MMCIHFCQWMFLLISLSLITSGLAKANEQCPNIIVPSQPTNVRVSVISSTEIEVIWDPPDIKNGVLKYYTISLVNQTVNSFISRGCLWPTFSPAKFEVSNETTNMRLSGLLPDVQVEVTVEATNQVGRGPPSGPVMASTLPDASEPVTNLTVVVSRNSTYIKWNSPCLPNGPLASFLVYLNGTRGHCETPTDNRQLPWQQTLNDTFIVAFNTSELMAESIYDVTVSAFGVSGIPGKKTTTRFTVPPRIPSSPVGNVSVYVEALSTTASVYIPKQLFPDTEGTIRYYAVLVAEVFKHNPGSGWLVNGTWPTKRTWANASSVSPKPSYQATPPWWQPFQDKRVDNSVVRYEIGSESCSPTDFDTYCNGPLDPGTSYHIRIRGLTETGYRDSDGIEFQTESFSTTTSTIVILLLILSMIIIVTFANMVIKGHIKWIKDKKVLEKRKFDNSEEDKTKLLKELSIPKFLLHTERVLANPELLKEEFDIIQSSSNQTTTQMVAQLSKNVYKNRYNNILPYDATRVILDGDDINNYINASHVKLPEAESTDYIACQGPKEGTCEAFWRMVIQYKVNSIVMLSLTMEKGMDKCFPYFPSLQQVLMFNDISVFCTSEEQKKDHTIRSFVINKGEFRFYCHHMHFNSWPDFGVPSTPETMVQFVKSVRQTVKTNKSVICVHCSAGVGRTGTFIAVDALLQSIGLKWDCRINVLNTVLRLRDQRCKMVQTEKQYKYIYQCLKYELENNPTLFLLNQKADLIENQQSFQLTEVHQEGN